MKVKLTSLGPCSDCGAEVFAELIRHPQSRKCVEHDESPVEVLARDLFARTGGRLPPPLSEVRRKYQQGPCSEARCRRVINPPRNHKGGL